jgi:NTE family protein
MNARTVLIAVLLLGGCAHYNEQLATVDPAGGYRFGTMTTRARQDDTMVIVTFSGGGTRAAALAYGVLEKLHATGIQGGNMLDAVDVVSSVSGGSYTAAYYALHGYEGLPELRKRLLDQPRTQLKLTLTTLLPWNAVRLLSPRYSRIDHAARFFDARVYRGAKFKDLRRDLPYTMINATEMDLGSRFEFTQEQFDPICSDLSQTPVAAAVAASSAFPVLLTPLTLRSYADQGCGYVPGQWFDLAQQDQLNNPRRFRYRSELEALMNKERKFVHLLDGGPADNIGVRGPFHAIATSDTLQMNDTQPVTGFSVQRMINNRQIRRVVVIVVNAKTTNQLSHDRKRATPWIPAVLSSVSNTPMGNFSFESVTSVMEWMSSQNALNTAAKRLNLNPPDVKYHFVEVAFSALPTSEQEKFNEMGTNYSLSKKEVAELIAVAGRILEDSQAFGEVVKEMNPPITP